MAGGVGNDTYEVTDAGDVVTEAAGEGIDTIWTAVNYALTNISKQENLFYGGAGNYTSSGNDRYNRIAGLTGDDILSGGAGNDVLIGDAGNDLRSGEGRVGMVCGGGGEE